MKGYDLAVMRVYAPSNHKNLFTKDKHNDTLNQVIESK